MSASVGNSQPQMQSYSLNWVSNPFRFIFSRKHSHKVNRNVSLTLTNIVLWLHLWLKMKWAWYSIESVTLCLQLQVTRRRRQKSYSLNVNGTFTPHYNKIESQFYTVINLLNFLILKLKIKIISWQHWHILTTISSYE